METKLPARIRKAALRAIEKGVGLEAIEEANKCADEINKVSFYELEVRKFILHPVRLI